MPPAPITDDDAAAFARDGYVFKRGLFDAEEVALLQRAIVEDRTIRANAVRLKDSAGGSTELALWNHPGDDLFGMVARCERLADGAARLLGGEVYHYHSKLTMKPPHAGGAWDWHQDYGYWYNNGCLFPDMLSAAIAIDPATRENGCLQFLRGSHLCGRIEHGRVGGQTGADMGRVEALLGRLDHVYAEMAAGDTVFFHANTLHASAANLSGKPRNVLLCCYNRASNDPIKEHHHPRYTKLVIVPDDRIKKVGLTLAGTSRAYFDPEKDETSEGEHVGQ
jgi:ectoine hydroxylase